MAKPADPPTGRSHVRMRRHDHKKGHRTMPTVDAAFRPASYWDPADRIALDAIRPSWMGGEYLPDCLPGEVEIARIVLESVTQDVVSIRARRRGKDRRILYRVVDEYESEFDFSPRSSRQPLTQGGLLSLIAGVQYGDDPTGDRAHIGSSVHGEGGSSVKGLLPFARVESMFYPALGEHLGAATPELVRALHDDEA